MRQREWKAQVNGSTRHPKVISLRACLTVVALLVSSAITVYFIPPSSHLSVAAQAPLATPTALSPIAESLESGAILTAANVGALGIHYQWKAHAYSVTSLLSPPRSSTLVSSANNGNITSPRIQVWNMQERPPKVVEGPFEDIAILAGTNGALLQLSMNGQFVTTVSGPYGQVWDAATGTQVGSISQLQPTSVSMVGTAIAVVGSEDGLVAVWAIQYPPGDYPEEGALPDPFDWSMAGASLITAFNLEQPIVQVLSDPLSEKTFVLTTRGELYIYTPGSDGFYGRVDSALQTLQTQGGERDIGYGVLAALEPGAAHIAYASERNLLTVVALQHGEPRPATEYTLEQNIGCVAYSPDGNLLLIGENNDLGTLHILETGRYARIAQVSAGSPIRSCTFSADGTWIATGHDDGSIIVWGAK